ncbi:MAG TPA: GTPase Era [Aeromonadales bacterium]|nr:GTPase Era [Aeromonadales bacterium]
MIKKQNKQKKCGLVAIVGRPNVGKSTLLNHLIGDKISITSRKPQTTRHRITGILTTKDAQIVFIDTPGLHKHEARAINRHMNRAASSSLLDVDAIVFVVDADIWNEDDELVLSKIKSASAPVFLFINKIDKLATKEELLPLLEKYSTLMNFKEIIPGSALKFKQLDQLKNTLITVLPQQTFMFPEDYITDRSERFLAAEIVREKLMRSLGDELPYSTTVEIEKFKVNEKQIIEIYALILIERKGQKKIVIGQKGAHLKRIGSEARVDMERLFGQKVFLKLWVKVKDGWADDERALKSLGYTDY